MHFDIYKSQEYRFPKLIFITKQNREIYFIIKIYFIYFCLNFVSIMGACLWELFKPLFYHHFISKHEKSHAAFFVISCVILKNEK